MNVKKKVYPSGGADKEWSLVAPYLTLMREGTPQRDCLPREGCNAPRWIVRTGFSWHLLPHDFLPWGVNAQTQRWLKVRVFQAPIHDLRSLLRTLKGRKLGPLAVVLRRRTVPASPESGHQAGYSGAKERRGREVPMAVEALGHPLALVAKPADVGNREEAEAARGEGIGSKFSYGG